MKKYIDFYIEDLEKKIKMKKAEQEVIDELLIKIDFFNKERIIHLIITLFYALFTVIFLCHIRVSVLYLIFALFTICFLIPYIIYYFKLEARVQYLYKIYDKLKNSELF